MYSPKCLLCETPRNHRDGADTHQYAIGLKPGGPTAWSRTRDQSSEDQCDDAGNSYCRTPQTKESTVPRAQES